MFLCNISHCEAGQKHLLQLESPSKGILLENVLGMFNYFKTSALFDFVSNMYANVSSVKEGRQWMVENPGTLRTVFLLAEDPLTNKQRVKHLAETIRNVMFCWEDYHMDLV